jgi:hypothetical protein
LQQLLADTLSVDDFLDFDTLKEAAPHPVFAPGPLANPEPPPNPDAYRPPEPTGLRAYGHGSPAPGRSTLPSGKRAASPTKPRPLPTNSGRQSGSAASPPPKPTTTRRSPSWRRGWLPSTPRSSSSRPTSRPAGQPP